MRLPFLIRLFVVGLLIASGLGLAWHQRQRSEAAGQAWATLVRADVKVQAEIHRAERRLAELTEARSVSATPATLAPDTTAKTAAAEPAASIVIHERLRQDPELQALRLAAEQGKFASRYAPLFRKLGLSPEQCARFLQIVMTWEERKSDMMAATAHGRYAEDDPATTQLVKQLGAECQAAFRELLGEDGSRTVMKFEEAFFAREMTASIAGTAVLAGVPLRAGHVEELVQLILDATPRRPEGGLDTDAVDWVRVDGEAGKILSTEQLAIFRSVETPIFSRFFDQLTRAVEQARKLDAERAATGK